MPALLFSILTPLFLPSSSVSLSYFSLAVPMRKCLGKHSCMSSPFPIAILNGTFFFRSVKAMDNWTRSAIKQILLLLLLLLLMYVVLLDDSFVSVLFINEGLARLFRSVVVFTPPASFLYVHVCTVVSLRTYSPAC